MSSMLAKNEYDLLDKLNQEQTLANSEIARIIFTAATLTYGGEDEWFYKLLKAMEKLLLKEKSSELPPILSSEGLTLTIASYNIRGSAAGRQFGIIPLIKAVNRVTNVPQKSFFVSGTQSNTFVQCLFGSFVKELVRQKTLTNT